MHQTTQQKQSKVLTLHNADGSPLSPIAPPIEMQAALQRLLNEHPNYIVCHLYNTDGMVCAVLRKEGE